MLNGVVGRTEAPVMTAQLVGREKGEPTTPTDLLAHEGKPGRESRTTGLEHEEPKAEMINRRWKTNRLPVAKETKIRKHTDREGVERRKAKIRPIWHGEIPEVGTRKRKI